MSNESERYELLEELHRVEQECFKRDSEIARLTKAEREQREAAERASDKLAKVVAGLRRVFRCRHGEYYETVSSVVCEALEIDRDNPAFRDWWERDDEDVSWDPYYDYD